MGFGANIWYVICVLERLRGHSGWVHIHVDDGDDGDDDDDVDDDDDDDDGDMCARKIERAQW